MFIIWILWKPWYERHSLTDELFLRCCMYYASVFSTLLYNQSDFFLFISPPPHPTIIGNIIDFEKDLVTESSKLQVSKWRFWTKLHTIINRIFLLPLVVFVSDRTFSSTRILQPKCLPFSHTYTKHTISFSHFYHSVLSSKKTGTI